MVQNTDTQMMLYRAHLLLEEGRHEAALSVLEAIHTTDEKQLQNIDYLLGWCYTQSKQWDKAIHVLTPLLKQANDTLSEETVLERERLAYSLLRLGFAAVNLALYEDASLHFTQCLKVLHDRRVHLPIVRIKARYSLAMTCIMRGMYSAAIQHYEDALRLCRHYDNEEELPHIYYGLADTYRQTGDYVKAYLAGQEALKRYEKSGDRQMEAYMQNLLGRIRLSMGDYRGAVDHYTDSLAISTSFNNSKMALFNCSELAAVRLAEGRLEEAKRYCQLALDNIERTDHPYLLGMTYQMVGQVALGEARLVEGEQRCKALEDAINWFEKALTNLAKTQAYTDMAEVYSLWAQTLEELGRVEEAIERWRSGYAVLSRAKQTKEKQSEDF